MRPQIKTLSPRTPTGPPRSRCTIAWLPIQYAGLMITPTRIRCPSTGTATSGPPAARATDARRDVALRMSRPPELQPDYSSVCLPAWASRPAALCGITRSRSATRHAPRPSRSADPLAFMRMFRGLGSPWTTHSFDPETSGGLLIAVTKTKATRLLAALHENGITQARIVGEVVSDHRNKIIVK